MSFENSFLRKDAKMAKPARVAKAIVNEDREALRAMGRKGATVANEARIERRLIHEERAKELKEKDLLQMLEERGGDPED